MSSTGPPNARLDARGLACPLPLLKTRKALSVLREGEGLEVLATDAGTPEDLAVFCRAAGHLLETLPGEAGVFHFLVRKGAARQNLD